jgi:hypothetical protein
MILSELWHQFEADKRIQGFSPNTFRAYALQLKMPSSLGHRIRLVRFLFRGSILRYKQCNSLFSLQNGWMDLLERVGNSSIDANTKRQPCRALNVCGAALFVFTAIDFKLMNFIYIS